MGDKHKRARPDDAASPTTAGSAPPASSKNTPSKTVPPKTVPPKTIRPPGVRSVGWALVQAARLHRARTGDRLAKLGLFAGQEQVVQALASAGIMTMGDLAALLRVRPPTASKTVTRLAALGIVERRAESGDGRVVRVRLTEAGLAKAAAIEQIQAEVEAELLDHLDKTDRRRLRKLLRKAARGLAEAAGAAGDAEAEVEAEMEGEDEAVTGPGSPT